MKNMKDYIKRLLLFFGKNRKVKVFNAVITTYEVHKHNLAGHIPSSKARKKLKDCYRYIVYNRRSREKDGQSLDRADKLRLHNMWSIRKYLVV